MRERGAKLAELEALYREELPRFVRTAAAITGDEGRGRDAVQDAFARAVRERRSFRREAPVEAWIWRIVVNSALDARRRAQPELELDEAVPAPEPATEDDAAVRAWVSALPERQRLAIFLRHFAGLDYRAIGRALDVEVGTVSATLGAAHAALRRSFQEVQR